MPEKCALSHGSGVLGRDPRDSCRFFWSPHAEKVCTVTQFRLGEGWGGGGIPLGGGGVGEPRTGIIYVYGWLSKLWSLFGSLLVRHLIFRVPKKGPLF